MRRILFFRTTLDWGGGGGGGGGAATAGTDDPPDNPYPPPLYRASSLAPAAEAVLHMSDEQDEPATEALDEQGGEASIAPPPRPPPPLPLPLPIRLAVLPD